MTAGLLAFAYLLMLALVGYLATIETAGVLVPLAASGGVGLVGSLAVVVANVRQTAGRDTRPSLCLVWSVVALITVSVVVMIAVGSFCLINADPAVGLTTLGSVVHLFGPGSMAAASLPTISRGP